MKLNVASTSMFKRKSLLRFERTFQMKMFSGCWQQHRTFPVTTFMTSCWQKLPSDGQLLRFDYFFFFFWDDFSLLFFRNNFHFELHLTTWKRKSLLRFERSFEMKTLSKVFRADDNSTEFSLPPSSQIIIVLRFQRSFNSPYHLHHDLLPKLSILCLAQSFL